MEVLFTEEDIKSLQAIGNGVSLSYRRIQVESNRAPSIRAYQQKLGRKSTGRDRNCLEVHTHDGHENRSKGKSPAQQENVCHEAEDY